MNSINQALLNVVLLPKRLYRTMGVNTDHLQAIVETKLIMDDRRPNAFNIARQKTRANDVPSRATLGTMFISLIMGLLFLFAFLFGSDYITKLTLYFSMFIFMLASTLISDFTSVLIDVRDNFIILPKPVNDRTFVTARLLHILVHVCKIILPMTIPGMITVFIMTGWGGLLFIPLVFFSTLFTIFIINAVYLLILKITTPAKFKNIISYIQIGFAIFVYAGFQLGPRMMDHADYENFSIAGNQWLMAFPPYWFAAAFETLYLWSASWLEIMATLMSFTLPVLSIYVVIKYLAPAFNQKLSLITGSSEERSMDRKKHASTKATSSFEDWLAKVFTTSKAEETGFLLTWKITGRSRDFKVKTYPAIGYMIVIVALFFFRTGERSSPANNLQEDAIPGGMMMMIYIVSMIVFTALMNVIHSEKFKAAWIYFVSPIEKPGHIISGTVKALLAKFYFPIVAVAMAAGVFFGGVKVLPGLTLALFNQLLIVYLMLALGRKSLPFSRPANIDQDSGRFMKAIARLFLIAMIAGVHFMVREKVVLIWTTLVISIIVTVILMNKLRNTDWYNLHLSEEGY